MSTLIYFITTVMSYNSPIALLIFCDRNLVFSTYVIFNSISAYTSTVSHFYLVSFSICFYILYLAYHLYL